MKKGLPKLIEEARSRIAFARNTLHDIKFGYGWADRFDTAEAGLTLVISHLYNVLQEVEKAYKERDERQAACDHCWDRDEVRAVSYCIRCEKTR